MQCDVYIAMMLILKALDCYVSTKKVSIRINMYLIFRSFNENLKTIINSLKYEHIQI